MKHSAIKKLAAGIIFLLLLSSCANGAPETDAASVSDTTRAAAAGEPDEGAPDADALPDEIAAGTSDPAEAGEEETAPPERTPEELLALAMEYIGKPADELIAVIGEPDERDYAPSCMGDGEDGNLYYGGLIVYTYRENGEETIQDVE